MLLSSGLDDDAYTGLDAEIGGGSSGGTADAIGAVVTASGDDAELGRLPWQRTGLVAGLLHADDSLWSALTAAAAAATECWRN